MESYYDIENNNKKLAVIEESITKSLLHDCDKKESNCLEPSFISFIYICLGFCIITLITIIVIFVLKDI